MPLPALNLDMPLAEFYEDLDDRLFQVMNEVAQHDLVSIDTETTGLDRMNDRVKYWSLAWGAEDGNGSGKRICLHARLLPYFVDIFRDPDKTWVLHNAKYDCHLLSNMGLEDSILIPPLAGNTADTMVMHSLLYEDLPHDLKTVSKTVLGWSWQGFMETFASRPELKNLSVGDQLDYAYHNDLDSLVEYASNDAYGALLLFLEMKKRLYQEYTIQLINKDNIYTLGDLYFQTEMPFTKVLWKCERRGAIIDVERLEAARKPINERLNVLVKDVVKYSNGVIMNPGSPNQVLKYLYETQRESVTKRTKGGKTGVRNPSTDEETLTQIYENTENEGTRLTLKHLLEYRSLNKLKGTYIDGLLKRLIGNKIHTSYNQHRAVTGRLSSSDPNIQ